jgi:hypothetical protein
VVFGVNANYGRGLVFCLRVPCVRTSPNPWGESSSLRLQSAPDVEERHANQVIVEMRAFLEESRVSASDAFKCEARSLRQTEKVRTVTEDCIVGLWRSCRS